MSDCSIKLQQEDLPAQLQQTADTLGAAGSRQTVDLTLDLQQLCSCREGGSTFWFLLCSAQIQKMNWKVFSEVFAVINNIHILMP